MSNRHSSDNDNTADFSSTVSMMGLMNLRVG